MTRTEYEDGKRQLDAWLREAVGLLEAAHRAQARALDLVWMATTPEPELLPPPPAAPPQPAPASAPPAPAERPRRSAGELYEEVSDALGRLPEVFEIRQLREVLASDPERGSLYRVLQELKREGRLEIAAVGSGVRGSKYRRK